MATLEKAIELAAKHHAGQLDKSGQPYILHPLAVMAKVDGLTAKTVAVLHDIIEDTEITADDLRRKGFSDEIVNAVIALTKANDMTRIEAAYQAKANPIARIVKLADLSENMNLGRISNPTKKDYDRLKEYEQVKAILEAS
ncbi:MAG: guanosine-3',5'-bis(diphosphate) 3'-pyrophosphohydrolase [Gammaproteobacteria bacterium]|nr:MAG: guanosine-3',5'-bis(diphosphate) 3'-pyrophosphohydrolase [Gammaproteobacteria bacterium]